jgi:ArsR family transcriptional regulator
MDHIKVLKALADENRLRIASLLHQRTLCVCEIEFALGMTQSNVSRHLGKLKEAGLVETDKQGQFIYYQFNSKAISKFGFLESLLIDINKNYQKDLIKLNTLNQSGFVCGGKNCK